MTVDCFIVMVTEVYGVTYFLLSGLILGLHPANERRRYFVTTVLIGWVQA